MEVDTDACILGFGGLGKRTAAEDGLFEDAGDFDLGIQDAGADELCCPCKDEVHAGSEW